MSHSSQPHGLQPTRLRCPWDLQGTSTGVGATAFLNSHWRRWSLHHPEQSGCKHGMELDLQNTGSCDSNVCDTGVWKKRRGEGVYCWVTTSEVTLKSLFCASLYFTCMISNVFLRVHRGLCLSNQQEGFSRRFRKRGTGPPEGEPPGGLR